MLQTYGGEVKESFILEVTLNQKVVILQKLQIQKAPGASKISQQFFYYRIYDGGLSPKVHEVPAMGTTFYYLSSSLLDSSCMCLL